MGYSTDFEGSFALDRQLDPETKDLINGLNRTRRMKRDLTRIDMTDKEAATYGVQGEFYISDSKYGMNNDDSVLNYNCPPKTQPSLWCHWLYNEEANAIQWDGGEKFYNYHLWIEYLINAIFKPKNYILNGTIEWTGETDDDEGKIIIVNNQIEIMGNPPHTNYRMFGLH